MVRYSNFKWDMRRYSIKVFQGLIGQHRFEVLKLHMVGELFGLFNEGDNL